MEKTALTLRTVNVTRYISPLREGGSLPALAEADDGFKYVLKFRGAGHGVKALIAELLGGEIARLLGLRVPELVFANLDKAFGQSEGDEEIQDLLKGSQGLNLGLHFLSGAFTFDPVATEVEAVNDELITILSDEKLLEVTNLIPENWLEWEGSDQSPTEIREVYSQFLISRKNNAINFVNQIQDARKTLI